MTPFRTTVPPGSSGSPFPYQTYPSPSSTSSSSHSGREHQPSRGVRVFSHQGWTITTSKQPILPEARMEKIAHQFKIEMPTMSFGDNEVVVQHDSSGWQLRFTMLGALEAVDKTANKMLKVAHSDSWQKSRQKYAGDILEVVKPFDWSFTTDYKGAVAMARSGETAGAARKEPQPTSYEIPGYRSALATSSGGDGLHQEGQKGDPDALDKQNTGKHSTRTSGESSAPKSDGDSTKQRDDTDVPLPEQASQPEPEPVVPQSLQFAPTDDPLPLDRLKRPDPILFFDEISLFEDELADNGLAQLSVKIRVMPDRLFILQRFYLRLNDVLFRLRDTRVCVEFETGEVWREYTAREAEYKPVASRLMAMGKGLNSVIQATWNPDNLLREGLLPEMEMQIEKAVLPGREER